MNYHDSLWRQAPASATHWGRGYVFADHGGIGLPALVEAERWLIQFEGDLSGTLYEVIGEVGLAWKPSEVKELHEKPSHWKTPEQLIADYRKDHGAEIEKDVNEFLDEEWPLEIDHLLDDVIFHLTLLEKHLAAERARVEGQS